MTSDESHPTPDEPIATPGSGFSSPSKQRKSSKQLIIALTLLGVLIVGGVIGISLFNRATAIDRSTPTVVVGQFLVAAIDDRDPRRVALFVCDQLSPAQALIDAVTGIDESMSITWGDYATEQSGSTAKVVVQLKFRLDEQTTSYSEIEQWTFDLVDQDGWRVCGVERP